MRFTSKHIAFTISTIVIFILVTIKLYPQVSNKKNLCGDLLSMYAEKPNELEFVKCETFKEGQTMVKTTYKVKGSESEIVEKFLIEKYKMGALKWICCGWETNGHYGSFKHQKLTEIHPDMIAIIDMYGSVENFEKGKSRKQTLEFDRNKLDYFHVIVELVII